jgi:hypothetical protein
VTEIARATQRACGSAAFSVTSTPGGGPDRLREEARRGFLAGGGRSPIPRHRRPPLSQRPPPVPRFMLSCACTSTCVPIAARSMELKQLPV